MAKIKPVKLAYKRFEPEGGADDSLCPVIFLHGLTITKDMWLDMPQVIADKAKRWTYALDSRNHGDSEFTDVFSFDANAIDLIHFMETMNISKTALVGLSMGAMTSIRVALLEPKKVEVIFAGDMHTNKFPKEIPDTILKSIKLWSEAVKSVPRGLSKEEAVKYVVNLVYDIIEKELKQTPNIQTKIIPRENLLNGRLRLRSKPDGSYDLCYNKDVVIDYLQDYETYAKEKLNGQYDGPAYFIYGSASPFNVAKKEEHIKKHFPKAELVEFEGASHDVVGDCWERFTNTVLAGLNK